jgi:hypothetical protein
MNISSMISDLQAILDTKGDLRVCVKESSGRYNTLINVGWDGDHIIGEDEGNSVVTINSYVRMR